MVPSTWARKIASNSWAACAQRIGARGVAGGRGRCGCGEAGIEDQLRSSHHHDFGLQRAGRLDRLQDADQVAGSDAERIEAGDQLLQG